MSDVFFHDTVQVLMRATCACCPSVSSLLGVVGVVRGLFDSCVSLAASQHVILMMRRGYDSLYVSHAASCQ